MLLKTVNASAEAIVKFAIKMKYINKKYKHATTTRLMLCRSARAEAQASWGRKKVETFSARQLKKAEDAAELGSRADLWG